MAKSRTDIDNKIEQAFYYAVNFYNTNDRSLPMQEFCLSQMMLYGLDRVTCIKIQNPVMDFYMMGELIQIGSQIAQQHLATITHNIHQHLLSLQPTIQPDVIKELPDIPTLGGNLLGSTSRDSDGVNVEVKNIVNDLNTNGYKSQSSLVMSSYDLEPHDMNYLSGTMPDYKYNFTLVDFSNNPRIEALGLDYIVKGAPGISSLQSGSNDLSLMYQGMLTRNNFNIVKLNLSNCNIGDVGADILSHTLASGKLPTTKHIDVSGNNITETGDTAIVQALKGKVQDMVIITEKLEKHSELLIGNKERKIAAFRKFISDGKEKGTYDEAIVVDQSWLGELKNLWNKNMVAGNGFIGFIKCHFAPEKVATGYAQDNIIAKLPKPVAGIANYATKLLSAEDIVTCYLGATNEAWTSSEGQAVLSHTLCVVGEEEFCGEQ